jgi:hypothetical protein
MQDLIKALRYIRHHLVMGIEWCIREESMLLSFLAGKYENEWCMQEDENTLERQELI